MVMVTTHYMMNLTVALFVTASVLVSIGDCHGTYRRIETKNLTETENTTVEVETTETETETNPWALGDPIQILEITRVEMGERMVRYTVTYDVAPNRTAQDINSVWRLESDDGTLSTIRNGTTSKPDPNRQLMSDSVEVMAGPPYVLYWLSVENVVYTLALNNTDARDHNLTNQPLPYIYLDQSEVVYDPGNDASFQIITSDPYEIYPSLTNAILQKTGTQDFVAPKTHFTISYNETLYGKPGTLVNVTIDMEERLSGVITTFVRKPYGHSFLQEAKISKEFVVRPSSQSGPFEEDLFAFYNKNDITDKDGNILQTCRYGEPTGVVCTAVGSKVTTITFKEGTGQDGDLKTVQGPSSFNNSMYTTVGVYKFSPKSSVKIVCEATDEKGRTISQITKILVQLPAKVISGTAILSGENYLQQLRIRCTGKGDPLPDMYITVSCGATILSFGGNELELVYTSETHKTITVTKDVMLPRFPPGYISVKCKAMNKADIHEMSIPLKIR